MKIKHCGTRSILWQRIASMRDTIIEGAIEGWKSLGRLRNSYTNSGSKEKARWRL